MGEAIKDQVAKYLTAFQLVIALLWWFIQVFGVDTYEKTAFALALVMLSAFVYRKDKDVKVTLSESLTPKESREVMKVISLLEERLLGKSSESKTDLEARLEALKAEVSDG